jgi:hypothetical protein
VFEHHPPRGKVNPHGPQWPSHGPYTGPPRPPSGWYEGSYIFGVRTPPHYPGTNLSRAAFNRSLGSTT